MPQADRGRARLIPRRTLLGAMPALGSGLAASLSGCASVPEGCGPSAAVTLPVAIRRGCPFIQVRINGQRATMLLDTGAETSFVTPEGVTALNLPLAPGLSTDGLGLGGASLSHAVLLDRFAFGPAQLRKQTAWVVPVPAFREMRMLDGTPIVGALGALSLAAVDIELDMRGRTAVLHPVGPCGHGLPGWAEDAFLLQTLPDPYTGRLWMPLTLDGVAYQALLDTGATVSSLSMEGFRRLGLDDGLLESAPKREIVGAGGERRLEARRLRLKQLKLGEKDIDAPWLNVRLYEEAGQPTLIIGMDILGQQPLWLSCAQKRVLLARTPFGPPPNAAGSTA